MDNHITVGIMTTSGGLYAWTTEDIPGTRTEDDHSECEEWRQQNSYRVLVQSHIELPLHHIDLAYIHRVTFAIDSNDHRQGDRRFSSSNSDNENSEDLTSQVRCIRLDRSVDGIK